mmetsp:Transcript_23592/g.67035  ORF Transcript_23592/g.67035 Transcript_23592/m.67035 type:complete len:267 (-) Transcript_23592:273-1073(-)
MLHDGLVNWGALQNEKLAGPIAGLDERGLGGVELDERDGVGSRDRATADLCLGAFDKVQVALGLGVLGRLDRELRACLEGEVEDTDIVSFVESPGVGGSRAVSGNAVELADPDSRLDGVGLVLPDLDLVGPVHDKVWRGHLLGGVRVEPDLEESRGVRPVTVNKREVLAVHNTFSGVHPLEVALAITARVALAVRVVDDALDGGGDGLEAAVRVLGEARDLVAVVEAPRRVGVKVHAVADTQVGGDLHLVVARRVVVLVVDEEEEG